MPAELDLEALEALLAQQNPTPVVEEAVTTEPPMCAVCRLRPAHTTRDGLVQVYCGGKSCGNPHRKCHHCHQTFTKGSLGAGTKFCSEECKHAGYNKGFKKPEPKVGPCARCGRPSRPHYSAQVCAPCQHDYANQIKTHHLSTEWAVRLIDATLCDACHEPLNAAHGRHQGQVDHDHGCCPNQKSCGKCVRGIICNRCNNVASSMESDAYRFNAVKEYLARYAAGGHRREE